MNIVANELNLSSNAVFRNVTVSMVLSDDQKIKRVEISSELLQCIDFLDNAITGGET